MNRTHENCVIVLPGPRRGARPLGDRKSVLRTRQPSTRPAKRPALQPAELPARPPTAPPAGEPAPPAQTAAAAVHAAQRADVELTEPPVALRSQPAELPAHPAHHDLLRTPSDTSDF